WLRICLTWLLSASAAGPLSAVVPTIRPMASARNTAVSETTWYRKLINDSNPQEKILNMTLAHHSATTLRYALPMVDTANAAAMAAIADSTSSSSEEVDRFCRYRRLTPLASTSLPPTLSRVRKVEAIPPRPLSRNSTRVAWVPTATMSAAPLA